MSRIENRNPVNIVYGVLAIIVTIIIIVWMQSDRSETLSEPSIETENVEEVSQTNFNYHFPENWNGFERASENIQVLGEGQVIVGGIAQDPTDTNFVYFATSTLTVEEVSSQQTDFPDALLSIYSYDNTNYTFERLYKQQGLERSDLDGNVYEYHLFGYDNGTLIFGMFDARERVDLFCKQNGEGSLKIDDPYGSFFSKVGPIPYSEYTLLPLINPSCQ
jgi:hypothetical protein